MPPRWPAPMPRPRLRWPAPTIRLRLALLYGAVFLITGAVLLTIGYLLVRNGPRDHHQLATTLRRLGKPASPDGLLSRELGSPPGSQQVKVAQAIHAEAAGLTEPFRRRNRAVSGFGRGLSIVRSVAQAHGGEVRVRARSEGGLAVSVTLPAAQPASERGPAGTEAALLSNYESSLTES